ncbi:GNAT family N-acetyltransferase [Edaphobacter albus]|uniref:GNAT family N-acetyltransferase n=1 Tax=Edaphobacter sp. 4G125 TaxID=2763071 RepID=UPI0016445E96|nr:GNAT family N-acetyltransferase [Edaphobacter sp. 4G125]QNI36557.1 GNAT family N-acetyltransferase [Edaphobacter sp. 4G125]
MTELVPITSLLVEDYKTVRLRALQDTPLAFGSTYARESQMADEEWLIRVTRLTNGRDIGFLARSNGSYAGLALCLADESDPEKGQVVSMWVAPEARRLGVGRQLIEKIAVWAADKGIKTLLLMVTSVNDSAVEFYRSIGFVMTGKTEPYPNDPKIMEYEMAREIGR